MYERANYRVSIVKMLVTYTNYCE